MSSESSSYDSDRQNLLSRLIDAVKECQIRFGGKGELATETDSRVSVLCTAWENCLKHGLKSSNRALAALKQMSDFTGLSKIKTGLFSELAEREVDTVVWHIVRETLDKHELERFTLLKNVTNDTGRGRAWLRASLNEKSLERYLKSLTSQSKLVNQYYDEWALIRDKQRFLLLTNMASGMASILFAITIDCPDLNHVSTVKSSTSSSTSTTSSGLSKFLPNGLLNTFQRPEASRPVIGGGSSSRAMAIPEPRNRYINKSAKIVSFDDDDEDDADESDTEKQPDAEVSESLKVRELRRNSSKASIHSAGSAVSEEYGVTPNLTPLDPSGSPIPLVDDEVRSLDSDVPSISCSWNEDSANALSLAAKARSASFMRTQGDGSSLPEEQPHTAETMSTVELKQAVITMMMKKDEIEDQNRHLTVALAQEKEYNDGLREENSQLKRQLDEQARKDEAKVQSVTRDNELLKHQLKKYITAVQMLRKDGPSVENLGIHLDDPQPTIPPSKLEEVSSHEATEYKKKLIQVAEMHGELMEFNEHLHIQLLQRENCIRKLLSELTELRGPLPADMDESINDVLSYSQDSDWRPLVNIWMPSVFLKGSSKSSHHVYQVFLRIKDDEWNVYRRYSEFHKFFTTIKKMYPLVATFEFPPKKTVGNKDLRFVEERRKKLQAFLRRTIQHIVSTDQELSSSLSRTKLVSLFPFLGEVKPMEMRRKSRRATAAASPTNSSPSAGQLYTGL